MGHSVSNQPMGVRVTSQIWLKFFSNIHLLSGYNEHMQNKIIQTPSCFGIMACLSRGGTPLQVCAVCVIEYVAFCNAL